MNTKAHTYLCIDYGTRKMGVAVGQTITATASALPEIRTVEGEPDWQQLDELVAQWQPDAFVIGMPYNMDGSESTMSTKTEAFGNKLREEYNIPCHVMDERLSTRAARDISRENAEAAGKKYNAREAVDSLAAQLILESWLEQNK